MSYHATVEQVYRDAAETPQEALCCVPQAPMYLPGLQIPSIMHEMNYGCGSTVHLQDMQEGRRVLYVGVGGGLEALRFAYFTRRPGGVIAIDPVARMREAARRNLDEAAAINDWFDPSFVEVRDGDALDLPVDDGSIDVAAQKPATEGQSAHEHGKHGSHGEVRSAEYETQRSNPDHLVDQGGRARKKEQQIDENDHDEGAAPR